MHNLVVDIGNSRTKVAVFNGRVQVHFATFDNITPEDLLQLVASHRISHSILSSVAMDTAELENALSGTGLIRFSTRVPLPVNNQYRSKETLGLDRLAGILGARALLSSKPVLVIDAGTCITYDLITADSDYYGGSISPGLQMRLKAMHTFTGRLPVVASNPDFEAGSGDDTQSAILSGVQNGCIYEMQGFIGQYQRQYGDLQVLLTGGDGGFFASRLKNSIFAGITRLEPQLVLIGLNEVIHYTNDQNR